jgi:hypothetical protein
VTVGACIHTERKVKKFQEIKKTSRPHGREVFITTIKGSKLSNYMACLVFCCKGTGFAPSRQSQLVGSERPFPQKL